MSKDDNGVISAEKSDLLEYATGIVAAWIQPRHEGLMAWTASKTWRSNM